MKFDPTKPVQTRDGRPVTVLTTEGREPYPMVGYLEESSQLIAWTAEGRFFERASSGSRNDLINVPAKTYTLTLNPEQAVALEIALLQIGGSPSTSLRGLTDEIQGLIDLKVDFFAINKLLDIQGYFEDNSKTNPIFLNEVRKAS